MSLVGGIALSIRAGTVPPTVGEGGDLGPTDSLLGDTVPRSPRPSEPLQSALPAASGTAMCVAEGAEPSHPHTDGAAARGSSDDNAVGEGERVEAAEMQGGATRERATEGGARTRGGTHVYKQDPRNDDVLILIRDGMDGSSSLVRGPEGGEGHRGSADHLTFARRGALRRGGPL